MNSVRCLSLLSIVSVLGSVLASAGAFAAFPEGKYELTSCQTKQANSAGDGAPTPGDFHISQTGGKYYVSMDRGDAQSADAEFTYASLQLGTHSGQQVEAPELQPPTCVKETDTVSLTATEFSVETETDSGLPYDESCAVDLFRRTNSSRFQFTASATAGTYSLYHWIRWADDSITEYQCEAHSVN